MDDFDGLRTVTRRQVLKGGAAVAALGGVSAFLAACSSTGATAAPATAAAQPASTPAALRQAHLPRLKPRPGRQRQRHAAASNYSDDVPKGVHGRHRRRRSRSRRASPSRSTRSTTARSRTRSLTTCRARRTTCSPGSPASACGSSPPRASRPTSATSGPRSADNYSDAFKVGSTGDDGKQYFIPIYNYPWAVFYRKSVFADKGYTIPTTLDEFKTLADQDEGGRPHPDRLRRQGRLAGDGHVRHPQPAPERLRLPRRADGRQGEVDGPEGQGGLRDVEGRCCPFYQEGAAGPDVAGCRAGAGPEEGRHVPARDVRRRSSSRRPDEADLATSTSSPTRTSGPQYDAEKALDAPIDGFMISAKSPTSPTTSTRPRRSWSTSASRRPRSPGCRRTRATSPPPRMPTPAGTPPSRRRPPSSSAAPSGSPSSWTATRNPNFAGPNGMQAFLLDVPQEPQPGPGRASSTKIQDFWDTL